MSETNEKVSHDVASTESKKRKKSKKKKHKKEQDDGVTQPVDATKFDDDTETPDKTLENDASLETSIEEKNPKKKQKKSKKKKKKKETAPEQESKTLAEETPKTSLSNEKETTRAMESVQSNQEEDDDNDDSDDELLAAAAMWAGDDNDANEEHETEQPKPQNLSLHITQLPYDSTELDLRKLFAEQGCSMTSIRLVYDHDTEGRKTVFRGVAFCDFLDVKSYEAAKGLHHKATIRGRRLNIRPCKSKEELAAIVARTQDLVRDKIHKQLSLLSGSRPSTVPTNASNTTPVKQASSNKKRKKSNGKDGKNKKPRVDKDGKEVKLTKKERNRRAAIIMQKRRRQRK